MKGKHAKGREDKPKREKTTKREVKEVLVAAKPEKKASRMANKTKTEDIKPKATASISDIRNYTLNKAKKRRNKKRIALIIAIIIVVLIAALIGVGYAYISGKIGSMNYVNIDKDNIGINDGVSLDNFRNIALLGVDSVEDDYGVGNRTDCIIIASVNKKTSEVKMFSIYRDTYVEIPGKGLDKINHAYAEGGPELALNAINSNLDLNVSEFVVVNFNSVADMVDSLGGVEMDIEKDEVNFLNSHAKDTAKKMGVNAPANITKTGKQTLNGIQAVGYSRIRSTEGLDYKRTERMRDVILAMFSKVKTKNVFELNNILNEILPEITTSLTTNEIISLLPNLASFNVTESLGWPYATKPYDEYGPWYGVPVTLETNVVELHKEVFGQENYEPSQKVKEVSEKIINKTGYKEGTKL